MKIPDSVTTLKERAFYGCSGFTGTLVLSNGLTYVTDDIFSNCTGFTELVIPENIESIIFTPFSGDKFKTIICLRETPPSLSPYKMFSFDTTTLMVPPGSVDKYKEHDRWGKFTNIVPVTAPESISIDQADLVVEAGDNVQLTVTMTPAEASETSVLWTISDTSVATVENGLVTGLVTGSVTVTATTINGYSATCDVKVVVTEPYTYTYNQSDKTATVSGLKPTVTFLIDPVIPESTVYNDEVYRVTAIGKNAFVDRKELKGSLTINDAVLEIGEYAFARCTELSGTLTLGNSIKKIGQQAFGGCGFTGSLVIPNSVTEIENYVFISCSGFTGTLTLHDAITSIGIYSFGYCSFTGTLDIPNSVTSINTGAFNGYRFSGELKLPTALSEIGGAAFKDCSGLTGALVIPEGVKTIGSDAFNGCTGFSELQLPESLKTIGGSAFYGCVGLSELYLPEYLEKIGYKAFYNCHTLKSITSRATIPPLTHKTNYYDKYSFDEYIWKNVPLYVPCKSLELYDVAWEWEKFQNISTFDCIDAEIITLDKEAVSLKGGESVTLTATVLPEDTTDPTVEWSSSDETVATVVDGVVTGLKSGKVTVTATTVNGLTATCEVSVTLMGDSNDDGTVNVADVVVTSNYIAGNEVETFAFTAADINADDDITVTDAVLTAQIILDKTVTATAISRSRAADMSADCLEVLDNGSSVELSLSSDDYSAFQADVVLPAGVEFAGVRLGDGAESTHTVMTAVKEGNMVRLVVFSLANAEFNGTVELQLTGTRHDDGTVEVYNAVASDAAGRSRSIGADINKGVAGIYDINAQGNIGIEPIPGGVELTGAEGMCYSIYTTTGVSVATGEAVSDRETVELPAGIYIVTVGSKTRKVVVR